MALENSSLLAEVQAIQSAPPKPVNRKLTAEILANNIKFPIMKVVGMTVHRDYVNNFADETFIEVIMGSGQFAHRVYPYKSNLILTVYSRNVDPVTKDNLRAAAIRVEQYRAILVDSQSETMEKKDDTAPSEEAMDLTDLKRVRFQLIDLGVEQIRSMTVGTIAQGMAPGDTLKALLTYMIKNAKVDDRQAVTGVEMYTPTNTEVIKQLPIKHAVPLTDLGDLIQNSAGIYSTGFGTYIQKGLWYVYPLCDWERFDKDLKSLTLIGVPKKRYNGTERTFRQTSNQTIALVSGEISTADLADRRRMNEGNGVRFTDPDRALQAFTVTDGNKATVLRSELNNELVTHDSPTGLNRTPMAGKAFTTNKMVQLSQLAAREGTIMAVAWEYSDIDAIYPGMPVKFMYESEGSVVEVQGCVWEAIHTFKAIQPGITEGPHQCTTMLLINVNVILS